MIDPRHNCYWVRRKQCELWIEDGRFHGAGVSLRVWLHAFGRTEGVWYSSRDGEHEDEVVALHLVRSADARAAEAGGSGPLSDVIGDVFPIAEIPLTTTLLESLGLTRDDAHAAVISGDVSAVLTAHDDCMVGYAPVDEEHIARVLESVLQMHGFYLGESVDWSAAVAVLMEPLASGERLRFRTHPARSRVTVTWGGRRFRGLGRARNRVTIRVLEGIAEIS